jgi:hypothetical protein
MIRSAHSTAAATMDSVRGLGRLSKRSSVVLRCADTMATLGAMVSFASKADYGQPHGFGFLLEPDKYEEIAPLEPQGTSGRTAVSLR